MNKEIIVDFIRSLTYREPQEIESKVLEFKDKYPNTRINYTFKSSNNCNYLEIFVKDGETIYYFENTSYPCS